MLAVLAAVTTLVVLVVAGTSSGGTRHGKAPLAARRVQSARGTPHLVVATAAWRLSVATSRAVAFPVDGNIDVLGGLTANGNSTTPRVLRIDPTTGKSKQVATLANPVHDAAGAAVGSRYLVFGGGAASVTASVQAFAPDTPEGTPAISVVGQLPAARADLASAEGPGGAVYLAGGYDGMNLSPDVVVTRDGTHFAVLARLPVPVRYPAMAVAAGRVWVIGGTATTGDSSAVQTIDLRSHVATVAGHLPRPLAHAAAANIGGTIYLFGGRAGTTVLDSIWALNPTHPWHSTRRAFSPWPRPTLPWRHWVRLSTWSEGRASSSQPQATVTVARLTNGSRLRRPVWRPPPSAGSCSSRTEATTASCSWTPRSGCYGAFLQPACRGRPRGSTSPMTPSSSNTAPPSSPTRKTRTPFWNWHIRQVR